MGIVARRDSLRSNLSQVATHVVGDALVVEQSLNGTISTDGKFLIPDLLIRKVHDVLGSDAANSRLNVLSAQTAASSDDLASDIFSNGSSAVQRQKNRCL